MINAARRRVGAAAGELVVPVLMFLFVVAYWADAAGLSAEALSFPLALTVVLALAAAASVVSAFTSAGGDRTGGPEKKVEAANGRALSVKTWMIILLPVPLIYFWRDLGAIAVFFVYAACVLFMLGERRRMWLLVLPPVLAVGLVYLFKGFLYVRLPDLPGVFGN